MKPRERREREARFLARVIPEEARIVGLVYPEGAAGRSASAAAGIASAIGLRREHTLLAAAEAGEGTLDELIGWKEEAGLTDALAGEARLTEVALRAERRPFVYLPAGASAPAPEALVADPRLRGFAERARMRGGTLLLHLPETTLPLTAGLLDGYVSLGSLAVSPPSEVEEYGRVLYEEEPAADRPSRVGPIAAEPRPPSADPAEAFRTISSAPTDRLAGTPPRSRSGPTSRFPAGPEPAALPTRPAAETERSEGAASAVVSEGRWRRHRAAARAPVVRAAVGALVVLAGAVGWWVLSRESIAGVFGPAAETDVSRDGPAAVGPDDAAREGEASSRAVEEPVGPEALLAIAAGAPELPYSVLIASYARASDAEESLDDLEVWEGGPFFLAPTPVRGRIYHRVFAGARADPGGARALMAALVEEGHKEAVSAWDVRPARLAFRLGVYGSHAEADAARRAALAGGISAYVLAASAGADTAFQLYAGAYESEAAAGPMAARLEEAGRSAELATRRGTVR